ncbi:FHA domain-containing protein [Candidatus Bathyarchaeota archaeon]|nr:FHA domain-containing protein [Candidatus Bathyarchaeota archaeon]
MGSRSLIENEVPCKVCGMPIHVPNRVTDLTCEGCGTPYKFRPEIKYSSYLKIIGDNKKENLYRIDGDLIIGRNDRDVLSIIDSVRRNIRNLIPVKTVYVSSTHSRIKTRREYQIIDMDNEQYIVNKQVCTLSDDKSMNGTSLDGVRLDHGVEKQLRHGSKITLAPGCRKYVEIEFIEKRED